MEFLSIFDEWENFKNKYIIRGFTPDSEEYIMIVYLFIQNKDNKILLEKDIDTNKWSVPGGHVISSIPRDDLNREMKEELGIDISNDNVINICTIKKNNRLFKLHLLNKNILINDIICAPSEILEVKYFTLDEINDLISNKTFKENNIMFIEALKEFKRKGLYEKVN